MKQKLQNTQRGITLVALIITIIVLLILAMVSISLVMNSGIIDKSKTAVDKYSQEEVQEQIKLAYAEWQTAQWTSDAGDAATFMQTRLRTSLNDNGLTVTESSGIFVVRLSNNKQYIYDTKTGGMLDEVPVAAYPNATPGQANNTENTKYTSDNKTAVIPKGYILDATQNSIDNGLVISKAGNEWVWIPVSNEDFSAMFGTATDDGWTMDGTDVKTKYKSNGGIINDKNGNPITRVTPGDTSSFREPDVLNNDSYDKNTTYLSIAGLGANLSEMATKLRDDYKNMIDSVRKNGGFYVGRYELSEAGTKKDQPSLTNTNWYNLYAKCKTFGDESTTYSRMIWGCQWDQVCKFISTAKDKNGQTISLSDSTSYGNYRNSENSPQNKINTGSNDNYKTNNIYDLAGNCYEWTQEASKTFVRIYRGGGYDNDGFSVPVTCRGSIFPTFTRDYISSRPVLYLK